VILLYAKTDKSKGAKGISAFVVETDNPGFRGLPTGELVFKDCRVPASAMLGAENGDVSVVMSWLYLERAMAACVGLPKGAGGRGDIHKLVAAAYLYADESFNKAVTEASHIHGGSVNNFTGHGR